MATNEANVEFVKTRPEHKVQLGGASYVCKHLAEILNNGEPVIESEITACGVPGEFAAICIPCAEYIWASLPKG
jgi:hypothetical protein